jgi:energy-coupling factor transporter ATP-binding protein EcfA2
MKLDLTSLYFNGDTLTKGNTASWSTSLGQKKGNDITVKGAQEIVDLMESPDNKVVFNPVNNFNHKADFKQIDKRTFPYAASFNEVIVNNNLIIGPFHLVIIEDTPGAVKTQKHWGRKNLKYNPEISINGKSNKEFYGKIQTMLGPNACWFVSEIFPSNNRLNLTVIKVSNNIMEYQDKDERRIHWESLLNDFSDIIEIFKKYCLTIRKIKHESSVNEYIRAMPKVKEWFVKNGVCDNDFQIWDVTNNIEPINIKLSTTHAKSWRIAAQKNEHGDYGFMMASWNRWNEFFNWYHQEEINIDGFVEIFNIDTTSSGLLIEEIFLSRFISSLLTKPFVILTGLSGSGKTKLAQAFAMWISESKEQYSIVPVGADWTNREPLLGYPNSLKSQHYVKPDSGVLDILLRAHENYTENNKDVSLCKPYFLVLDEMNLSHVERYFADFLSAMESGDEIKLYSGSERYDELNTSGEPIPGKNPIPNSIVLPKNLFIIGTVNIDETTYMFSPKVLDRANTIEFRISRNEMAAYLENHKPLDMDQLLEDVDKNKGKGAIQTEPFMALAARKDLVIDRKKHQETFVSFFQQLQRAGTEFGYRTANEMTELVSFLNHFSVPPDEAYDIAIMQKLLPKLNGSRSKLSKVLPNLGALCLNSGNKEEAEQLFNEYKVDQDVLNRRSTDIKFKLSFEKLCRMNKNAQDNGFASYAEA